MSVAFVNGRKTFEWKRDGLREKKKKDEQMKKNNRVRV